MTPDQIVSAVRAHLDRIDELAEGAAEPFLHGDRTGLKGLHPQILRHLLCHAPSSVLSLTAAIRKLLAEYEECRAYYEANPKDPAGEVLGFWTSIEILAQGLGIDTDKEITE